MKKMLFVGSPPPPYHGQAIITQIVFETEFASIDPMFYTARFSEELSDVGGVSLKKLLVLVKCWWVMLIYALGNRKAELYYCAGSAYMVPFFRDILLLGTVGKLFKKRYVHYHSGGLPSWLAESKWRDKLGKWIYDGTRSQSIACSNNVEVPSGNNFIMELPNGLEVPESSIETRTSDAKLKFLYVGALRETKGVMVLLEAVKVLVNKGYTNSFTLEVMGEWISASEKEKCEQVLVENESLVEYVNYLGRVTGDAKWNVFSEVDVFVFPTFYESENMPLVVIEALGSGLPVISTNWRSIPGLVEQEVTGFLVEPKNVTELAERMEWFLNNREKVLSLGSSARSIYEQKYSKKAFQKRLREILGDVC